MTRDEHGREGREPVPQHHARLDDPHSPATVAARAAAERFAIETARRKLDQERGSGA